MHPVWRRPLPSHASTGPCAGNRAKLRRRKACRSQWHQARSRALWAKAAPASPSPPSWACWSAGAAVRGDRVRAVDLLQASPAQRRAIRRARVGLVFQEPMTALSPLMRVGQQVAQVLELIRTIQRRRGMPCCLSRPVCVWRLRPATGRRSCRPGAWSRLARGKTTSAAQRTPARRHCPRACPAGHSRTPSRRTRQTDTRQTITTADRT